MFIKQINVSKENLWEVLTEDGIYALKSYSKEDGYYVKKVRDCDFDEILTGEVMVFRIVKG